MSRINRSARRRFSSPVTLALLVASALTAWLHAEEPTNVEGSLRMIAPACVMAGQPIHGQLSGGMSPLSVNATCAGNFVGPNPGTGPFNPLNFTIPTNESMSGKVVNIYGSDAFGAGVSAAVFVN